MSRVRVEEHAIYRLSSTKKGRNRVKKLCINGRVSCLSSTKKGRNTVWLDDVKAINVGLSSTKKGRNNAR